MSKALPITNWVSTACLTVMVEEARRCLPYETGGAFMGYWSDPSTVVITHVIGPGPNAMHSMHSFNPDVKYHDAEVERIYFQSGRISTYLGDWHTHPRGTARTSQKDRKTLLAIASAPEARAPIPLMAILAINEDWKLAVWSWQGKDILWKARVALCVVRHFDRIA
jgi:integrative and conjugative element protein (TIGR02256 family)